MPIKKEINLPYLLNEAKEIYLKDINEILHTLAEITLIINQLHERIKKLEEGK